MIHNETSDLPQTIEDCHKLLLRLGAEMAEMRRRCPELRTSSIIPSHQAIPGPEGPRPTAKRAAGGCGGC